MASRRFSCREPVYPSWQDAVALLPEAGIGGLEVNVRPAEALAEVVTGIRAGGLEPMTLAGGVKLDDEASVSAYVTAIEAAASQGIPIFFTSAHGAEDDRHFAMGRLRELGDVAAARGVTIALETHPPFCLNAAAMLATMRAVDHPNVGINFDTANIYYYNEGLNSADELVRVVDHVVSLHLKDTDGGFRSVNFPVLGEGVVPFERIFATLDEAGFAGPLTLELEGPLTAGKGVEERHAAVVASMGYLRSIGVA